jgi:tetratricopeptide (TPR) repeat protein
VLADNVYQDLVGVTDPEERKRRIIAAAERQSQAAPPPRRPFIGVPPRIASFTGRAEELDRLDAILTHEKPAAVTQAVGRAAVQGMGGVGKTSLAVEYAHRYRKLYAGVCWCPAETRTGLLSTLAALAMTLGAATADEANIEKAAKAALRRLDEQRATWLLVYDNVPIPDEIADLLPSGGARVLITSRFSDWRDMADEVALDVLPPEEAIAFLQTRTGRSDASGAKTLGEALGQLPLALDHAAAYCKRTQMRFSDYAAKASSLMGNVLRGTNYPRSVMATFDLAITQAVSQCAEAELLTAFLAQCAPERISMLLVEGAFSHEDARRQALAALAEVSLAKHDPFDDGTEAVSVHRLVQAVALARSRVKGLAEGATDRLMTKLAALYPYDGYNNPKSWPLCAQLTPHLLALRAATSISKPAYWADLLNRAGGYFHGRAAHQEAASLFREALTISEQTVGPEHRDTAAGLHNLANLLRDQGDLTSARPLCERALAICEKVLGPEHPETALSLEHLALLMKDRGELVSARPLHERALAIREKVFGPEHPHTALSLDNLAALLHVQGDFGTARSHYERALAICEKEHGPDHPDTASSLNNLAVLLKDQGELASARRFYERALVIREKVLGSEHPKTATTLNNLANLLQVQGDFTSARQLYERVLAIEENTLGHNHSRVATTMSNLARLLRVSAHADQAEPLIREAIAIGERTLGREHSLTQRYATNYGRLLVETGRAVEALPVAQFALATHEAAHSPNHPWTKDSARLTADALDALGRTDEAKVLRERYGVGAAVENPKAS